MGFNFRHKPTAKHTAVAGWCWGQDTLLFYFFITAGATGGQTSSRLQGSRSCSSAQGWFSCPLPWGLPLVFKNGPGKSPSPLLLQPAPPGLRDCRTKAIPTWLSTVKTAAPGAARWLVPSVKSQVSNSCCHTNGLGKLRNHRSSGPWAARTYPKPVHEGPNFGCDFFGILQPYIGQEKVALPGALSLHASEQR